MEELRTAQDAHRRLYEERVRKEQLEKETEARRNEEREKQIEQDEEYSRQLLKELQGEGGPEVEAQDYQRLSDEPDGRTPMRTGYTDTLIPREEPWWIAMEDVEIARPSRGARFFSLGEGGLSPSGSSHADHAHGAGSIPAPTPTVGDGVQGDRTDGTARSYPAFPGFPVLLNTQVGWQTQHRERLLNFQEGLPEMPNFTSRSQGASIANAALRRYLEWSETQRFIFLLGIGSFIAFLITVFCRASEGN